MSVVADMNHYAKFVSSLTSGKICGKPLLENKKTFPDSVFSGSGGDNYWNARFTSHGWCPSSSNSFLTLDLKNQYNIKKVFVLGSRDQYKWSGSYTLEYGPITNYSSQVKVIFDSSFKKDKLIHDRN